MTHHKHEIQKVCTGISTKIQVHFSLSTSNKIKGNQTVVNWRYIAVEIWKWLEFKNFTHTILIWITMLINLDNNIDDDSDDDEDENDNDDGNC